MVLHDMNLTIKVWSTSHTPRYEIAMKLPCSVRLDVLMILSRIAMAAPARGVSV